MVGSRTSYGSSSSSRHKHCGCGESLLLFTSSSAKNPGRKFLRCPNWNKNNTCKFFAWLDEENAVTQPSNHPCSQCSEMAIEAFKSKIATLQATVDNQRRITNLSLTFNALTLLLIAIILPFLVKEGGQI
ncbi:Zinc finger, GRF-type [Sesbania bispinosa]|nr:Zinc finger, GRF-type [Sesbania bispinosa]